MFEISTVYNNTRAKKLLTMRRVDAAYTCGPDLEARATENYNHVQTKRNAMKIFCSRA
jgi:hypothetical protein